MVNNGQDKITDLATPADEGAPATEIEVCGSKYLVLEHALETSPRAYVKGWTLPFTDGAPTRCIRCGVLIDEDTFSIWSRVETVTCRACRGESEVTRPHCVYCGKSLVLLLPILNPDGLWFVWVCGWHHTHLVSRSEEGI